MIRATIVVLVIFYSTGLIEGIDPSEDSVWIGIAKALFAILVLVCVFKLADTKRTTELKLPK